METGLKQKLANDLKQAMRSRDDVRRDVIRFTMAAIGNVEIAKQTKLTDPDVLDVISKEIKKRHESIELFKKGNRQDLVDKEEAEIAVLQVYLPKQLTREEIAEEARQVIKEVGAQSPSDKGKVMSMLVPMLKGKADGRDINAVVTELLAS